MKPENTVRMNKQSDLFSTYESLKLWSNNVPVDGWLHMKKKKNEKKKLMRADDNKETVCSWSPTTKW